jgi:hypothetical protein
MRTKIVTIITLQFIFIFILNAQITKKWDAKYSGPVHTLYEGRSIALDAAGNSYVAGISRDTNFVEDFTTIKYNANGVQQWVQTYNGPGNDDDEVNCIAVDASGNVYVSGSSKGNNTGWDFATIKYNTNGVQQWVQRYTGTGNGINLLDSDRLSGMVIDNWGNVYVTGTSYGEIPFSDPFDSLGMSFTTIKYDSNGTQKWIRKFNELNTINVGRDYARALAVDNSGNIYVTGQSEGMNGPLAFNQECVTIKYNSFGDSLWTRKYVVDPNSIHGISPIAIAVNNSGYVFVTGVCAFSVLTGGDYFTVKYNSAGDFQWVSMYTGPGNQDDYPTSIAVDVNDVYVTGMSMGNTGNDYATVKYNFSGVQQWAQRYNGPGNGVDAANSIKLDASGYIYVTGSSVRDKSGVMDIATIKYDSFGNQKWIERFNGIENESNAGYSLALNSLGDVFVTGAHADTLRGAFQTIKYSQAGNDVYETSSNVPDYYSLLQNYPNPFNTTTKINFSVPKSGFVTIKVFDVLGREVATLVNENKLAGNYSVQLNAGKLVSGIYFYKFISVENIETRKMILLK